MKRRALLPPVPLDRTSRKALHSQLARAVRTAIDSGQLPAGAVLPSTRAPDWRAVVRSSQYPADPVAFRDPDGNQLYFHR